MTESALKQTTDRQIAKQLLSAGGSSEALHSLSISSGMWPGWSAVGTFTKLRHFDAIGLRPPLQCFPCSEADDVARASLKCLLSLDVSDNVITSVPERVVAALVAAAPKLRKFSLAGNRIASLDGIKPLSGLATLRVLDLEGNPIDAIEGYRTAVFECLPQLAVLDGRDREGKEVDDDDADSSGDESNEAASNEDDDDAFVTDDDDDDDDDDESQDDGAEDDEEEDANESNSKNNDRKSRGDEGHAVDEDAPDAKSRKV